MSRQEKRASLAALREARETGKKREWVQKDSAPIYDEVSEKDYKQVVAGRLMKDDFVVDEDGDGASGYADNGMDDWDRGGSSEEDEEEEESRKKLKLEKAAAKAKAASLAASKRKAKPKPVILPGANPYINSNPKASAKKPPVGNEDDFMDSLLGNLDGKAQVGIEEDRSISVVSKKMKFSSSSTGRGRSSLGAGGGGRREEPKSEEKDSYDSDLGGMEMEDYPPPFDSTTTTDADGDLFMAPPPTDKNSQPAPKEEEEEEDLYLAPTLPTSNKVMKPPRRELVNATSAKPLPPPPPPAPTPAPVLSILVSKPKATGLDWRTAVGGLAVANDRASSLIVAGDVKIDEDEEELLIQPDSLKIKKKVVVPPTPVGTAVEAREEDGNLRFWWFDYVEPGNGILVLIGKVKSREGNWVSATVLVKGIRRRLFVLPRAKALDSDGNVMDDDDDEPPEFDDVESDFYTDVTERWGLENVIVTPGWVRKKYAFGIKGIPREEADWLEAFCDFPAGGKGDKGDIPIDASGERYSHVFGSTATPFEIFVVDRKIMGPCWLNLRSPDVKNQGISWTKLEVEMDKDDVSVFAPDDATALKAPPLTIMSISLRTVVHLTENKREVVCASARVWQDAYIDDPTPIDQQPSSVSTLVRPLFTPFPNGFEAAARSSKPAGARAPSILPLKDEKILLTQLLAIIFRTDPDVIVGQDFSALELDVLLNRLKELKIDHWSRVGRLRRPKWPKLWATRNTGLMSGRLIVDLSSDGSKSIIDSTTWSLTEMCLTHLKVTRDDIDPEDIPKYFDNVHSTAKQLLEFVGHCEADCYFQMAVAFKVQALPLTRQLTTLAGNSWNKTLAGNRAERNEFILLHRFNERGYVCPDKILSWEKKAMKASEVKVAKAKAKAAGEEEVTVVASKEKYKGGLVFDPKKGLWDRFVLVMDFNSLYPSIIQEFDIDFSTIDWTADDAEDLEKMPDRQPCSGEPRGILPQLIASLVQRRQTVKKLMKERGVAPGKMLQYDITQKALKLTANSMYGCLGFEGSRFYARPLAALTTFKGREILTRTKADAESLSLDVIYGDTDSVMINTDQTDINEAHRIGNEFKKLINEKYKKLEIDTDAVFACMLLLAKKKYAALKVEENGDRTLEVKGLDMKRREFCELSKNVSKTVLDLIMSGRPTEDVVNDIHEHLTTLGEQVRAGRIPMEQYIIYKRLGKNPQDYPDAKSQPHVSVALKMKARGQSAKAGDVIPYIFCLPESGISTTRTSAANAYHPDEVRRAGSTLKIDFEVYLTSQILPPIERLCDPIEGTEKARLAECLGLDIARFKSSATELPEREFKTLQSQVSDKERFALTEPFRVRCRSCDAETLYDGFENSASLLSTYGIFCSNADCAQPLSTASIAVQLDLQIRSCITKFYACWLVCDDASCGNRTRMMSVYGKRCLGIGCRGQVHPEYSDTMLYNQLLYFDSLFDVERALGKVTGTNLQATVQGLVDANKTSFTQLRAVVQKHLDKNGRRWVSMGSLFSFLTPK